jgi:hypothetical protein
MHAYETYTKRPVFVTAMLKELKVPDALSVQGVASFHRYIGVRMEGP